MKEDILEGLKNALSKGESLQYAMNSFRNAGYDIKNIEEAARELQLKISQHYPKHHPPNVQEKRKTSQTKKFSPKLPVQKISNYERKQTNVQEKRKTSQTKKFSPKPPIQRVSSYEKKQINPRKIIVIIILILLVMLILLLGGIFLFKERLLSFFDNFFS